MKEVKLNIYSANEIRIPNNCSGKHIYDLCVKVLDLAHILDEWLDINPRKAQLGNKVAKGIKSSLMETPDLFIFKSRGLSIMAHNIKYDNHLKQAILIFSNNIMNGLYDGGHNYKVFNAMRDEINKWINEGINIQNAYVLVQVTTGFNNKSDIPTIINICDTRNTSNQVKDQSLQNKRGYYDEIKKILQDTNYHNKVRYSENETDENDKRKPINVSDLIIPLLCMNVNLFNDRNKKQPDRYYNRSSNAYDYLEVEENRKTFRRYINLLPQVLNILDYLQVRVPQMYLNTGKSIAAVPGIEYLNSVKNKEARRNKSNIYKVLPWSENKVEYILPKALLYILFSPLRVLICDDGINDAYFTYDPIKFIDNYMSDCIIDFLEYLFDAKVNPTAYGNNALIWEKFYNDVAKVWSAEQYKTLQEMLKNQK